MDHIIFLLTSPTTTRYPNVTSTLSLLFLPWGTPHVQPYPRQILAHTPHSSPPLFQRWLERCNEGDWERLLGVVSGEKTSFFYFCLVLFCLQSVQFTFGLI